MREVAFITGGAVGFGRALAQSWAQDDVAVVLADIDLQAAQQTAAELRRDGGAALAVACDVADPVSVAAAVDAAVAEFGGIDMLVNNAALHLTTYSLPFAELGLARVAACVDVNLMGVIHCTMACSDSMAQRGRGRVVNLSSSAAYEPRGIYGVTKLAVRGLTTAFAAELAPQGTRVNAVAPGLMATESAIEDLGPELFARYAEQLQLVPRSGEMADVVAVVRFLCSEAASFITGETLRVTGGYPLSV